MRERITIRYLPRPKFRLRFIYPLRGGIVKTVTGQEIFSDGSDHAATQLARQPSGPERSSLDEVFSLAYEELRRLARSVKRSDPRANLTPTTIVNEAWLKLERTPGVAAYSPLHFKHIAARAMRQVMVDAARRRHAQVRGGRLEHITFDESLGLGIGSTSTSDREVLALDAAIEALNKLQPRQAALVEARFFGGLDTSEICELLEISEATALRDWRAAKAWLAVEVRRMLS
jgi:RNA polymerase sigma factor (TIGR02999 family)